MDILKIIIGILVLIICCCSVSTISGIGGTWYYKKCEEPLADKDKIEQCQTAKGIYDFKHNHCNHGEKVDAQRNCWKEEGNAFYNLSNQTCLKLTNPSESNDKILECVEKNGIYDFKHNHCNHGEPEHLTSLINTDMILNANDTMIKVMEEKKQEAILKCVENNGIYDFENNYCNHGKTDHLTGTDMIFDNDTIKKPLNEKNI